MEASDCQMMTRDELKALVRSERSDDREQAVRTLVNLLTSSDANVRGRGYELFREGLAEVLFRSCLNYGSLAGGFTDPLVDVLSCAVEFWAAPGEIHSTGCVEMPHP
jgi:hypothetical protein